MEETVHNKKKKEKREADNRVILSKYQIARSRLKQKSNILGEEIGYELGVMEKIREKYTLNTSNEKLLNERMALMVSFKEKLVEAWKETLGEVEY